MADIGEIICTARCTDIWSLGRRGFWRMGRVTDGYRCRCCCVRMAISKITSSNYIAIYSNDGFGQLYHPSVAFWACQGAIGFWDRKKNMIVQQENPKKSARKHRMLSSVSFPLKATPERGRQGCVIQEETIHDSYAWMSKDRECASHQVTITFL